MTSHVARRSLGGVILHRLHTISLWHPLEILVIPRPFGDRRGDKSTKARLPIQKRRSVQIYFCALDFLTCRCRQKYYSTPFKPLKRLWHCAFCLNIMDLRPFGRGWRWVVILSINFVLERGGTTPTQSFPWSSKHKQYFDIHKNTANGWSASSFTHAASILDEDYREKVVFRHLACWRRREKVLGFLGFGLWNSRGLDFVIADRQEDKTNRDLGFVGLENTSEKYGHKSPPLRLR